MRVLAAFVLACTIGATALSQQASDPRAAGITVTRAINTAENATRQASGKYAELPELLNHPAMARVRADIVVSRNAITHHGQQVRLALTPDAMQYQVMVVPAETCGTAIFSDERGLIYTGKVLDC